VNFWAYFDTHSYQAWVLVVAIGLFILAIGFGTESFLRERGKHK